MTITSKLRIRLVQMLIAINEALIFYPRLRKFYRSIGLEGTPVILDVGANKGQSIRFFKSLYPDAEVWAFEPNPGLFTRLEKRFHSDRSVRIFNWGISDAHGVRVLNKTVMDETSSFEELNEHSSYLKVKARVLSVEKASLICQRLECQTTTLAQFISEHRIPKVDILKIDTEGHEHACLKGLFIDGNEHRCDLIQIEYHEDDMYSRSNDHIDPKVMLLDNGFQLVAEVKHGFGEIKELVFRRNRKHDDRG